MKTRWHVHRLVTPGGAGRRKAGGKVLMGQRLRAAGAWGPGLLGDVRGSSWCCTRRHKPAATPVAAGRALPSCLPRSAPRPVESGTQLRGGKLLRS